MSLELSVNQQQLKQYENIIQQFKVTDIQKVLDHFKLPRAGRKVELVERLTGLLKTPAYSKLVIDQVDMFRRQPPGRQPYQVPSNNRGYPAPSNSGFGANGMRFGQYGQNYGGATMHGAQGMMTPARLVTVRNLKPIVLPFFDLKDTILEPVELSSSNSGIKTTSRQQLQFSVSPEQQRLLQNNRYDHNSTKPRYELQIRFFNITGDYEGVVQPDDFPLNCSARIDEHSVTLPNVIPTNKPNAEPKRPSRPVNITPYCAVSRGQHRMNIEWTADKRVWAVGVYFVYRVDSNILRDRAVANPQQQQSSEATKAEIARRLGGGDDDDVAMDHLKISLLCPLSKLRMSLPARCRDCTHLQCFDLNSYLQMNEKRPTWKCAVCSSNAPYDRLIIDDYFADILRNVEKSITEVELKRDGGYDILTVEPEDLSDDDDDNIGGIVVKNTSTSVEKPAIAPSKLKTCDEIIVLSDSDDEDAQLKRVISNSIRETSGAAVNSSSGRSSVQSTTSSTNRDLKRANSNNDGQKGDGRPPSKKISADVEVITLDDTPPRPAPTQRVFSTENSASVKSFENVSKKNDSGNNSPVTATAPRTNTFNLKEAMDSLAADTSLFPPTGSNPHTPSMSNPPIPWDPRLAQYSVAPRHGYQGRWDTPQHPCNNHHDLIGRQVQPLMAPQHQYHYIMQHNGMVPHSQAQPTQPPTSSNQTMSYLHQTAQHHQAQGTNPFAQTLNQTMNLDHSGRFSRPPPPPPLHRPPNPFLPGNKPSTTNLDLIPFPKSPDHPPE